MCSLLSANLPIDDLNIDKFTIYVFTIQGNFSSMNHRFEEFIFDECYIDDFTIDNFTIDDILSMNNPFEEFTIDAFTNYSAPTLFFWMAIQIYLLRVWLLYFDMQLSQILNNRHWQIVINPMSYTNNWYLNPKNQNMQ